MTALFYYKQNLLTCLLVLTSFNLVASDEYCVVNLLSTVYRFPTTRILKECFNSHCESLKNVYHSGGVIRLLFDEKFGRTKAELNDFGAAQDFKDFAIQNCPLTSQYGSCFIDTIRHANLTMTNGSTVDLKFFQEDVLLAMQILPNAAFCDATPETKQLFYKFLEDGGRACITDEKLFMSKIAHCLFSSYAMDDPSQRIPTFVFLNRIKRCAPPLIRNCTNGDELESLFNQTVTASLFRAYNSTWEAMNRDVDSGSVNYRTPTFQFVLILLISFVLGQS